MTNLEMANNIARDYVAEMLECKPEKVPKVLLDKIDRINNLIRKSQPYTADDEMWDIHYLRSTQLIAIIVDEYLEQEKIIKEQYCK